MHFTSIVFPVLGLATLGRSHMLMATPVPFGKSTLNNSPLAADGSDFPCKQRTGVYSAEGASNTMAIGSSQPLSFVGSAVHGGGSCQISVTYDDAPTKSSVFKVIHSIEGGCPMKNIDGNNGDSANEVDPDTYSFTIPSSLPTGTAVLAWTWFNKIGNREMYMNCAPVTITGASAKRSDNDDELLTRNATQFMERDSSAYDALPDMFVANVGNGCGTVDSTDVIFPNPGDSVEQLGLQTSSALSKPTGASCAAAVAGSGAAPAPSAAAPAPSAAAPAPSAAAPPHSAAPVASAGPASSPPALSGGVFATVATGSGSQATPSPAGPAPVVASSAAASAPAASPVASFAPSVASPATPAGTGTAGSGTSGSGSAFAAGTACTTEGMWNCIGGTFFQQCASGAWSVAQELAAGTSCTPGQSTNINIVAGKAKRAIRFSNEHVRRHFRST